MELSLEEGEGEYQMKFFLKIYQRCHHQDSQDFQETHQEEAYIPETDPKRVTRPFPEENQQQKVYSCHINHCRRKKWGKDYKEQVLKRLCCCHFHNSKYICDTHHVQAYLLDPYAHFQPGHNWTQMRLHHLKPHLSEHTQFHGISCYYYPEHHRHNQPYTYLKDGTLSKAIVLNLALIP